MIKTVRDFTVCPRCGAPTKKAIAFNGGESEFWYECTRCNTFINTYIPQAHQYDLHVDNHKFIGNFGGYGSGKTLTSREEVYKHIFLTPNGNTLIGANVAAQFEQTIKRDIESDIPMAFVKEWSTKYAYIDFRNGHRLMFRSFDDPNKLRSLNLTMFVIVEASEVKPDSFTQLKTRARNVAATEPARYPDGTPITKLNEEGVPIPKVAHSWIKGIIESNPDPGWIKQEVLLYADKIYKHGHVPDVYDVPEDQKDPAISVHITDNSVNAYLPPNFIADLSKNKPAWWIARYCKSSFMYAEGLVYPSALKAVLKEDIDIKPHWKRIIAFDYGLSDDAVFLFGAIDEIGNTLYIYKEIRNNNKNIEELANIYLEAIKEIPPGGLCRPPIIDPMSGPQRDYNKKSLADHFLEYGIAFIPGFKNIDARVYRLNTYLESGRLKILPCCKGLIDELQKYKFRQRSLDENASYADKPVDKDNHAINPLEWIVMELPANPNNLVQGVYARTGKNISQYNVLGSESEEEKEIKSQYLFARHALSDDNENTSVKDQEHMFNMVDMLF